MTVVIGDFHEFNDIAIVAVRQYYQKRFHKEIPKESYITYSGITVKGEYKCVIENYYFLGSSVFEVILDKDKDAEYLNVYNHNAYNRSLDYFGDKFTHEPPSEPDFEEEPYYRATIRIKQVRKDFRKEFKYRYSFSYEIGNSLNNDHDFHGDAYAELQPSSATFNNLLSPAYSLQETI